LDILSRSLVEDHHNASIVTISAARIHGSKRQMCV
jgi:hypothetical protein